MVLLWLKKDEWDTFKTGGYDSVFGYLPSSHDSVDFAIVAVEDKPVGFVTCKKEGDKEVYLAHGGVVPEVRGSLKVNRMYHEVLKELKKEYSIISTRINITNQRMIKLAFLNGFKINDLIKKKKIN